MINNLTEAWRLFSAIAELLFIVVYEHKCADQDTSFKRATGNSKMANVDLITAEALQGPRPREIRSTRVQH